MRCFVLRFWKSHFWRFASFILPLTPATSCHQDAGFFQVWTYMCIFSYMIFCFTYIHYYNFPCTYIPRMYKVFIKYCVFSLQFCDFSQLCQFCCSAGVLPALCVYTNWHRGKTEKGKSPECFKIFEKTQHLMNTLYILIKETLYVETVKTICCDDSSNTSPNGFC